jgi:Bifunctional DNA primase/polymerase, N-terminal/Primase C terminal 1 (PriCT-1)
MGIANTAAEIYAKHGIPAIPLGEDKRPLVGGFKVANLSMAQSRAFMRRRPDATALGIPDGRVSGIVRLDIDEHGEDVERTVIDRAGDTPAKVQTASGKRHLIYTYNGERRLTGAPGHANARPWADLKVDLCGDGGFSVSPPSRCKGGEYELLGELTLEQLLENRHQLPVIQGLPERAFKIEPASPPIVPDDVVVDTVRFTDMGANSGRNTALFDALCKEARNLPQTIEAFEARARELNQTFGEPMIESRVINTAKSVFGYVESGQLRTGEHGAWFKRMQAQELARDPYLFALIAWLKAENGPNAQFQVADGLCQPKYLDWPRERLQQARRRAMDDGWIVQIRKPAPGVRALYRWGTVRPRSTHTDFRRLSSVNTPPPAAARGLSKEERKEDR